MQNTTVNKYDKLPGTRTSESQIPRIVDPQLNDETFERIGNILRAAELVTGMALSVVDNSGNFLLPSEMMHFCLDFAHKQCPGLKKKCEASFKELLTSTSREIHDPPTYECTPLGIKEFKVPVRHKGKVICCIIGGGVVTYKTQRDKVCERLINNGCKISGKDLFDQVDKYLPIVEDWKIEKTIEIVEGVAFLLEEIFNTRWEQTKLTEVTRIDAAGRRLIGELDSANVNPLKTMSEIARELARAARADACCVWAWDSNKNKMFPLITSGFSEEEVLKLPPVDPQNSLPGRVMLSKKSQCVNDIADFDDITLLPLKNPLVQMGFQTLLCVPVIVEEKSPAAITVFRKEQGQFGPEEKELLSELAPHMWEAISKAEVSRSAKTQAEITRMLNVNHDSDALYDQIAEKLKELLGAAACSIFFRRGLSEEIELRGTTGVEGSRENRTYKFGKYLTGWVAKSRRSLRVYNCEDKSELAAIDPNLHWSGGAVREKGQERLKQGAIRSFLACPLTVAGELFGVVRVCVASLSRSVFSHDDESLLDAVAADLGVAWKRFRLADEVRRISEENKTVFDDVWAVHQAVVNMAEEETENGEGKMEVVRLAFNRIMKRNQHWQWVNLRIPDEKEQFLKYYLVEGKNGTEDLQWRTFPLQRHNSLGVDCFIEGKPIYCPDIAKELRYGVPLYKYGAKSCYNHPLIVSGKSIGVLSVDSREMDDFDKNARDYLQLLTTQLATAFTLASSIEALRDADMQKQAHLEAMAHQLIAPLSAIRVNCENLVEGRTTAERLRKSLVSVAAQSHIAARTAANFSILADLLTGRANERKMQKSRQNIVRLIIDLARDYQPMAWANEKDIFVRLRDAHGKFRDAASSDSILAGYDEGTFPQVVGNVLENAVKYSDDFTEIIVNVEDNPRCIRVQVTSQGVKLAKNEVEKIFDPSYRTDEARLKFPPGTGIGLPIARSIIEAHRGRLYASPTDDQGRTAFVIELPR